MPRGPDGQGSWSSGRVAFGHRRLSVIDLSPCGAQPMVDNELGLTAVFNGCIYDYQELRAELEGHGYRFFSHSDTEVILKGYHHWGTDVVSHLHGMFAFVDPRAGHRPRRPGPRPARASSRSTSPRRRAGCGSPRRCRRCCAAGDVDTSIDPVALHHYLTWHAVVPAPRTILNGVRKLPPATVRVIEADGSSTEHRYWEPRYERRPEHASWSARDWEDAIEEALRVAVRRRLVADIPVGVLLSGGLDSSLIVGLLAQEGQTGLATYSIGFESVGGQEGDEFAYSDVIAEHFGTDHHRIRVGSDELAGALGHAIGAMAEPMVSHDVVAFDLLSERVSQTITVVQSGQGADEVFAGYHWYPPLAGLGPRGRRSRAYARAVLRPRPRGHGPGRLRPVRAGRGPEPGVRPGAHVARRAPRPPSTPPCASTARSCWSTTRSSASTTCPWRGAWRRGCRSSTTTWSSWPPLCPPELKLADGGKGVLKAIGRRIIPPEVIDRPKGYFPVPAITHLEGKVLDLVRDALASDAARERGAVPARSTCASCSPTRTASSPRCKGNKLWQLGLLELWLQTHGV